MAVAEAEKKNSRNAAKKRRQQSRKSDFLRTLEWKTQQPREARVETGERSNERTAPQGGLGRTMPRAAVAYKLLKHYEAHFCSSLPADWRKRCGGRGWRQEDTECLVKQFFL
ncbi:UNVERIFIED_CONTAM: hypothetical protein HHA_451290 [Hammondia hammondi]|eukprot:XP_008884079.1 hypothetical protein HHA_451290 [Hammondia hammondi]